MRSRRALVNSISNVGLQVAMALTGFILPGLLISRYGSEVNGMIGSIRQFMAYLGLVEAGVGAASMAALYAPLAAKDYARASGILSATRSFYIRSGYIFSGLVVLFSIAYPLIVRGQVNEATALVLVLIVGSTGIAEYFLIGKYRVLLAADQRNYVVLNAQTLATMLSTGASVALIFSGAPVVVVQAVAALLSLTRFFVLRRMIVKSYPQINFRGERDDHAISARWSAFAHQVAGIFVFNGPIVIVTIFLGLTEVSVYVVYNMVFAAVHSLISVASAGIAAGFGQLLGLEKRQALRSAYDDFEFLYFAFMSGTYASTAVLVMPFIHLYTNDFTDADYVRPEIALLFILVGIGNNTRMPANALVAAAGLFRETRGRAILEAAIVLFGSLALVGSLGLAGVLIGSLLAYSFRTVDFLLFASNRILHRSVWQSVWRLVSSLALGAVGAFVFASIFDSSPATMGSWLVRSSLVTLGVFVVVASGNALLHHRMFRRSVSRVAATWRSAER